MTFISYSQNLEDVMLYRALGHIDQGCYVDVGANDPISDSVTKAFYDAGWRGINIEPVAEWYDKLVQVRPDDINLKVAAGASPGSVDFFEVIGTGLSTTDEEIAAKHAEEAGYDVKSYQVPVLTLNEVASRYSLEEVHFLKVDVEGAELAVLQGLDLTRIRPWIIVIESTLPNSQKENYREWESIITASGYRYVYFDGLNRFYVSGEHSELEGAFSSPPNYFDHYTTFEVTSLNSRLEATTAELARADERIDKIEAALEDAKVELNWALSQSDQLTQELHRQQEEVAKLRLSIHAIHKSTSWRITAPLRWFMKFCRGVFAIFKLLVHARFYQLVAKAVELSAVRRCAAIAARRCPRLYSHLRSVVRMEGGRSDHSRWWLGPGGGEESEADISRLTPNARRIYDELSAAVNRRRVD